MNDIDNHHIYISLTCISSRLPDIERVIHSLLNQTLPAQKIILNISHEPFLEDKGISESDLPPFVHQMIDRGRVELCYCANSGPYRKILPTLERYADSNVWIATADDDVIYPDNWLEGLVKVAKKYKCISAYRCRLILIENGHILPYNIWPLINSIFKEQFIERNQLDQPSLMFFPTGRDGILYHSSHLRDLKTLYNLRALAPFQDDISLKFYTLMKNIPVAIVPSPEKWESEVFPGTGHSGPTLWNLNQNGENDKAISRVLEYCKRRPQMDDA
ncbi:glycosyltransferase family 2 protein [Gluconacetobacter liquefaciens]|uniref:Glycosyltransferase family 2 protein n=1 Tax=Gluconacetobacter liquefaciens TaxID=89584 RepID=A0A370G7J1_GLULI|nr:glycosyltransferase family A protein [Gluconacetobacter liquefaciens]MBB2185956.1 glycosyltransferase family 2 protein [Gluconacetobacter liquefaciens]RDI39772.1 hypothetical protein C7453_102568 [Gluconacetobacter liquefaciens]